MTRTQYLAPTPVGGDPQRQADIWAAHNPYDLAPRLRGIRLFVSVGNGQPGPLDKPGTNEQAQQIEQALYPQNTAFVKRLRQLGIPVTFNNYGPAPTTGPTGSRSCIDPCRCCWLPCSSTEKTVRPAPPGGRPAVQTVTGATSRPRSGRTGSRRSGGSVAARWPCQH